MAAYFSYLLLINAAKDEGQTRWTALNLWTRYREDGRGSEAVSKVGDKIGSSDRLVPEPLIHHL